VPSSTWPVHIDSNHLYFITASAISHHPIFRRDVIKRIMVDSINTGRILGQYELFAFVIMPNHIHWIIRCIPPATPNAVVREYKKATANLLLRQFECEGNEAALAQLAVAAPARQSYAVWDANYLAKNVYTPDFLRQKLTYIHNNPLQPHWRLAERAEDYLWSSAGFYLAGKRSLIPLSDARSLL